MDIKGVPYYNPESIRLISQAANAPVFAYSDMGFGEGAVGGYILSFSKIGPLAGETAVKILQGANPAEIIITEHDIYDYLFDWRELKRWGLAGSKLIPKGSTIRFEEISFFEKFRLIILIVVLFLVMQSLFIIFLVRLNRKYKQIAMQLIEAENKYRELVSEDRVLRLGQLTASLSHELNQPLTAILSTAQAGIRFVDSGNPEMDLLKELFQNIVEDDKRTASILSSIRGMMKLEKREKEKVNLNVLIEEIIYIFRGESTKKSIRLEMILSDQPVCIQADAIQIQQVIMNLILNAIQSIEKAHSDNRLIIISEIASHEYVTVSVRDYGEGIAAGIIGRLFKPFVTSKKEGTGIGLSISRSIIDDHQGKIWAENMPDGGALFAFSMKICKDEQGSL
jgi:signal transduction histidine kinase